MKKIPQQEQTAEFSELAVKRVRGGQSIGVVAQELGLIVQTLQNGVKAAVAGKLNGPGAKVVTPEQMELPRVRAENIRLNRENDILTNPPWATRVPRLQEHQLELTQPIFNMPPWIFTPRWYLTI